MQADQTTLHNRQAALIRLIFDGALVRPVGAGAFAEKGLQVYQNNLLMTAARALSLSHPVTEKMIGEEAMRVLTRHLLASDLPSSGDWADWGGVLSALIKTTSLHDENPYVADVAQLEWLLHQAGRAAATELDTASLSRLSDTNLSDLHLHLGCSISTLCSLYPIDALWQLHQKAPQDIDSRAVFRLLSQPQKPLYLLIYQKDHIPCIERLTEEEYLWINALQSGLDLDSLLEQFPAFDFSGWLTRAIEKQWLHKFSSQSQATEKNTEESE